MQTQTKLISFSYKEHLCKIQIIEEPDVVKAWHTVVLPSGEEVFADISPYDRSEDTVKLWIDAGYPKRQAGQYSSGPLHAGDLRLIISKEELE